MGTGGWWCKWYEYYRRMVVLPLLAVMRVVEWVPRVPVHTHLPSIYCTQEIREGAAVSVPGIFCCFPLFQRQRRDCEFRERRTSLTEHRLGQDGYKDRKRQKGDIDKAETKTNREQKIREHR
jgi:hypothetical protein